jgi:hypothetical protein
MQLQSDIGLKSSKDWGSSTLGMRDIKVVLIGICILPFILDSSMTLSMLSRSDTKIPNKIQLTICLDLDFYPFERFEEYP